MSYFREVSDLLYHSQQPNRNSSYDYVRVKNIFRRAKIREDIFNNTTALTKYKIIGDERPEQVAQKVYGSPEYDWVILTTNNIINIRDEWPISNEEFNRYLKRKYTTAELNSVHHYETLDYYDYKGKKILKAGKVVDSDYALTYFDSANQTVLTVYPVKSISVYEYEVRKNEEKRNIYVLKPRYLQAVIDDMREIMSYGFSSQYVDDKTKKGGNV